MKSETRPKLKLPGGLFRLSRNSHIVSPLEGIRKRAGTGTQVSYADGSDLVKATNTAKQADVAIVFVIPMKRKEKTAQPQSSGQSESSHLGRCIS